MTYRFSFVDVAEFFDAYSHRRVLGSMAASALSGRDTLLSFMLSDRGCRIAPTDEPDLLVMRADASYRMGWKGYALADLDQALAIAPEHRGANARVLSWSTGAKRSEAARTLITNGCGDMLRDQALGVLLQDRHTALGSICLVGEALRGWAIWRGRSAIKLTLEWETGWQQIALRPDPRNALHHWLGKAASWQIPIPDRDAKSILVRLTSEDGDFLRTHFYPDFPNASCKPDRSHPPKHGAALPPKHGASLPTNLIVPVFRDVNATSLCLQSIEKQLNDDFEFSVVVVDDASPEPELTRFVQGWVERQANARLITNTTNLGFAGSVAKALASISRGDVVLVNSDTVIPRGALQRLVREVSQLPDIGTATPLSNNGELTSFPLSYRMNPLPSLQEIEEIDRLASKVNAGKIVDIPSGIGFCLFISRACLQHIGGLSDGFGRGYLEDVDFCLRARGAGFRNVCITSVFVGHAGSVSFGTEKRILVMRHIAKIHEQFPHHSRECSAFMAIDPLSGAREAIERARGRSLGSAELFVACAGPLADVLRERTSAINERGKRVIALEVQFRSGRPRAFLIGSNGSEPQATSFGIDDFDELSSLVQFLRNQNVQRLEFIGPGQLPGSLVKMLCAMAREYDIVIADAGLICRRGATGNAENLSCALLRGESACACSSENLVGAAQASAPPTPSEWDDIARMAKNIWAVDPMSLQFSRGFLPPQVSKRVQPAYTSQGSGSSQVRIRTGPIRRLGALHCGQVLDHQLMHAIARHLQRHTGQLQLIIMGPTLDDFSFMRCGNVFVTGAVDTDEYDRVMEQYGIDGLFLATRQPLFGHPVFAAARFSGYPIAYFDWSRGSLRARAADLPLDPGASVEDVAQKLGQWASLNLV